MVLPNPRVKPLGWIDDEIFTAPQATQLDSNIAALDAAIEFDRSVRAANWPDRASFANSTTLNAAVPIAWDGDPASPQGVLGANPILMVTTGDTRSFTSDDGVTWTGHTSFGGDLLSAAYDLAAGRSGSAGGVRSFLATGTNNGNIIRTTDAGTTWTLLGSTIANNSVLCNGTGKFWVAAGDGGSIWHSTDGLTWTQSGQSVPAGWTYGARRVAWNGHIFAILAYGFANQCLISSDGLTWTLKSLPVSAAWNGLVCDSLGLWVTAAGDGHVALSGQLGILWLGQPTVAPFGFRDLAVIDDIWVAVGNLIPGIVYSRDRGASWRQVLVGDHRTASGWSRVIAADDRFVAVHATGSAIEFALSLRKP
jgi:hypothetical protein